MPNPCIIHANAVHHDVNARHRLTKVVNKSLLMFLHNFPILSVLRLFVRDFIVKARRVPDVDFEGGVHQVR